MRLVVVLLAALLLSCTDEVGARRQLEKEGYTDIRFTGHRPFRCFKGEDNVVTGFEATDSNGVRQTGAVCCGFFCTIRTD